MNSLQIKPLCLGASQFVMKLPCRVPLNPIIVHGRRSKVKVRGDPYRSRETISCELTADQTIMPRNFKFAIEVLCRVPLNPIVVHGCRSKVKVIGDPYRSQETFHENTFLVSINFSKTSESNS